MRKYCGKIGYEVDEETRPGVIEHVVKEKTYYGDIQSFTRNTQNGTSANDNLTLSMRVSILADPFIQKNIDTLVYLTLNGTRWKIASVEIQYPRLILVTGGIYNGPKPDSQ
jgi:sialic acid synthase SpsE